MINHEGWSIATRRDPDSVFLLPKLHLVVIAVFISRNASTIFSREETRQLSLHIGISFDASASHVSIYQISKPLLLQLLFPLMHESIRAREEHAGFRSGPGFVRIH